MAGVRSSGPSPSEQGRWLLLLGILAILPLAALAGFAAWHGQRLERLRAHESAHALCLATAESAEGFVVETRNVLAVMAGEPAVTSQDPAAARQALAVHLASLREYVDLSAAKADGLVYADPKAAPGAPAASIANEPYFQEALEKRDLSIHPVVVSGPDGPRTLLVFCMPVVDPTGQPIGTVQAYCDPTAVPALARPTRLPEGASLVLVDAEGTILLHSTDPARWTGRKVPAEQSMALLDGEGGAREGVFLGQPAVVGTNPVEGAPWRVAVVIPAVRALAGWQATLWGLGTGFVVALGVALYLGVRTAQAGQRGWEQHDFLSSLVESASVGVAVVSGPGDYVELANPPYHRIAGRPPDAVVGRPLRQVFPAPVAQVATGHIAEVYRTGRVVRAREIAVETGEPPHKSYWDVDFMPLRGHNGRPRAVLMLAVPVTERVEARQRVEALAQQAEERAAELRAMLAAISDAVLVFDVESRLRFANDTALRFVGMEPAAPGALQRLEEAVRTVEMYWADGRPVRPEERQLARVLRGERIDSEELMFRPPTGEPLRWERISAAPVRDGSGRITGAVVTASDITAQKEAQAERERLLEEVQAAREELRSIINRLPDGVLVIDRELRVSLCNETAMRYTGHDMTGMSLIDLRRQHGFVMPDGQPFPPGQSPVERALRGEVVTSAPVRFLNLSGAVVDALESTAPLFDGQGRISGAVIALTDVTELRRAQAERERLLDEVQAAREELTGIINRLPDGVLVIDPTLHAVLCNDAVRAYIGRDVTGEYVPDLWREFHFAAGDGRPFPRGQTPVERALRGETVVGVEVSFEFPGGKRVDALDSAAAVYNPDGSVREVAMVFTDITPLKELDRAKDEFISFAAHELRTPLTALKGHTQILLRRAQHERWAEADQRSLRTIDSQVDRLNDLIGRLLDVSRIRLGRLQLSRQPTDLIALAREVAEELQVTTTMHRIRVQAAVPELVGNWDPSALRQVLNNLIGNAIRYADPGPIDVYVRREPGRAVLTVTDHGPGIPPERQARIFEAFQPAAPLEYRRAGGLGLGLYISRGIVEAHGGRMWLESQVGVGSTFGFTLPLDGRA